MDDDANPSYLLAVAIASVFGQIPSPVKAGDLAPNLSWTRILAGGDPGTFIGRVTVIGFFPVVSPNESLVSRWNELVTKFDGQPVHFVWIASEYQPPLDPWLEKHPFSGCLLLDPLGATAQAYGVEFGGVIVDANSRIAGFTFALPEERQIKAIQEGTAIAIKGDADDSKLEAILAGRPVRLDAEPHLMHVPEGKPDIPPSLEVRISRSKTNGTEETRGPDWWVQRGFDLKTVIAKVYEQDLSRIIPPEALQNEERYDFVLVPPHEMDAQAMRHLLQQAIERHFNVSASVESERKEAQAAPRQSHKPGLLRDPEPLRVARDPRCAHRRPDSRYFWLSPDCGSRSYVPVAWEVIRPLKAIR